MFPVLAKATLLVWREALEAILVIGLIRAFFIRQKTAARTVRWAHAGVLAGLGLSLVLGMILTVVQERLPESFADTFKTALLFLCAGLMTQMVFWMNRHSRTLKRDLELGLGQAVEGDQHWAIFLIALSAVAREGIETVIYLYGTAVETLPVLGLSATALALSLAALLGVGVAIATSQALARGFKALSMKRVFQITTVWLLLSAVSLIVSGVERLESLESWGLSTAPLWDLRGWFSQSSRIGAFLHFVAGYRDRPTLVEFAAWAGFWVFCRVAMSWSGRQPKSAAAPAQLGESRASG